VANANANFNNERMLKNRSTFIKVMKEYQLARFYRSRCSEILRISRCRPTPVCRHSEAASLHSHTWTKWPKT